MLRNRSNSWLIISSLTVLIALVWAGVTAYSVVRRSTIPPDVQKVMEPIDPNLDQDLFKKLQQRTQ